MLITNTKIITWGEENQILEGQAVYIEADKIKEIGPEAELKQKYADAEVLDGDGKYLMPGNIIAHTHYYGAFARGMGIPGAPAKDFPEILDKLWWPLDKALDEDAVRYSALVSLIDGIKHGCTTMIDHHASPSFIDGSLDVIAETMHTSGMRGVLCYEVTDRDGKKRSDAGIRENLRFIEKSKDDSLVKGTFGLHASLTLEEATLKKVREELPDGVGVHIHVAEHEADEYDSLAKTGERVVDRLNRHELLGENTILAHCVHVDAVEIALLSETQTWVTHQPRSNMNNGVGMANVESMMRAGIPVCLGNDGMGNQPWAEWKTTYLAHKLWNRDPRRMNGMLVVEMAIENNADLVNTFFTDAPTGEISEGSYADLILVDYHPYTPMNAGNLPWQIIFGFHESMVTHTIAAGKLLMKDRILLTLDEAEIAAKARELAPSIWKRYEDFAAGQAKL